METKREARATARTALVWSVVFFAVGAVFLGAWTARYVLLLVFAGWLGALVLASGVRLVQAWTSWRRVWALVAVVSVVLLAALGLGALVTTRIAGEARELQQTVSATFEQLRAGMSGALRELFPGDGEQSFDGWLRRITGMFSTAIAALGGLVFAAALALFFAAEPGSYETSLLSLVPARRRDRVAKAFTRMSETVERWLLARLATMTLVGILTWVGLALLGVRLALTLALIAALLDFVPNVGPILAAAPAVLVALGEGPQSAAWVALLYVCVQTLEAYVITPLLERRAVRLQLGTILTAQAVLGFLLGALGLVFATPLLAASIALVETLRGGDEATH
jgi:predicted PurR-regulated permease PerM